MRGMRLLTAGGVSVAIRGISSRHPLVMVSLPSRVVT